MQLDINTLVLMFVAQGITSTLVMFMIWRINSTMPGVRMWMLGTFLNVSSSVTLLLNNVFVWSEGIAPFLSNSLSLTANLLVLEGTLRFRCFESRRRTAIVYALIPLFILMSWVNRFDPGSRYLFHDSFTMSFVFGSALVMIWRTSSRDELLANLLAAASGFLIFVTISWRWWLALTGNESVMQGMDSAVTQWYLFFGTSLHVAWIFGLSIACYFRSHQQVMQLAREDVLTGLPNRRSIDERLGQTLLEYRRSDKQFAVLMIDINEFKQVNDQLGHSAGDQLLIEMAQRLSAAVRGSDFAGRLGGDEFIVLARDIESDSQLSQMQDRMREKLDGDVVLAGQHRHVTVSLGAALCPSDGDTIDSLLRAADTRMYKDKAMRRSSGQGDNLRINRTVPGAMPL